MIVIGIAVVIGAAAIIAWTIAGLASIVIGWVSLWRFNRSQR